MTTWAGLAIAYAVASRLAYVIWVGQALRGQDRDQSLTRHDGIAAGFRRFRTRAQWIMRNDALAIIVVCVVTRDTLHLDVSRAIVLSIAALLVAVGLGTKLWAARTLGDDAYYWHNFFATELHEAPDPPGPYRYLDNPMYTVGYLHAYGAALALDSGWGLAMAAFDQVAILAFHQLIEKPHYQRAMARSKTARD